MASLNTVFKQVFGEGLKEYGFAKIKGRQPYLVRLIGDEIVQVIACRPESPGRPEEYKEFDILAGIATVYRPSLNFSCCPRDNLNWIEPIRYFYSEVYLLDFQEEIWKRLCKFEYRINNDASLRHELESALEETKNYVLPVFDGIMDLEACIDYLRIFNSTALNIPQYDLEKDAFVPTNFPENEGLLYIQTNSRDDLREKFDKLLADRIKKIESEGLQCHKKCEQERKEMEEWRLHTIERRDNIYNDPEVYARAIKELKQRKSANLEVLRDCGLDV